jgi:hypothetical protein
VVSATTGLEEVRIKVLVDREVVGTDAGVGEGCAEDGVLELFGMVMVRRDMLRRVVTEVVSEEKVVVCSLRVHTRPIPASAGILGPASLSTEASDPEPLTENS